MNIILCYINAILLYYFFFVFRKKIRIAGNDELPM